MSTVETAKFGAEFVSARTWLCWPIDWPEDYSEIPWFITQRKKFHVWWQWSCCQQCHASICKTTQPRDILNFPSTVWGKPLPQRSMFTHIPGENNPANIVSEHWGYSLIWHMLRTLQATCWRRHKQLVLQERMRNCVYLSQDVHQSQMRRWWNLPPMWGYRRRKGTRNKNLQIVIWIGE